MYMVSANDAVRSTCDITWPPQYTNDSTLPASASGNFVPDETMQYQIVVKIMDASRNKRLVDEALRDLSERLNFRYVEGLAERVVFREFYPRGLTAADELNAATLGARPTMSHATAQLEVQGLISSLLGVPAEAAAIAQSDAA